MTIKLADEIRKELGMKEKYLNDEIKRNISEYIKKQFVQYKKDYVHEKMLRIDLDIPLVDSLELYKFLKDEGFQLYKAETLKQYVIIKL